VVVRRRDESVNFSKKEEDLARQTIALAKYIANDDKQYPFFGLDRNIQSTRFTRPYVDERKWYQKIEWLQKLARKILND
jgi:hypothetical protein